MRVAWTIEGRDVICCMRSWAGIACCQRSEARQQSRKVAVCWCILVAEAVHEKSGVGDAAVRMDSWNSCWYCMGRVRHKRLMRGRQNIVETCSTLVYCFNFILF